MKYLSRHSKNHALSRAVLALVFTLSILRTYAQNYKCLQYGPIHYFSNSEGYLRGMRIDSVRIIGSDTVYYPFHTVRGNYCYGVLDCNGGSWLGKKVIEQPNGDFLFDNIWQDTVVIKTMAALGDSWTFYNDTADISYTATVTGIDTATIYGTVDSIKILTITAFEGGLANHSDPVDSFQIKISKHFGFLQVFDLMTFPYHYPGLLSGGMPNLDYYLDFATTHLVSAGCGGLAGPYMMWATEKNSIFRLVSFYNPTMMEIYDNDPGDEFEYAANGWNSSSTTSSLSWDSVLSKTVTPYSISYPAKVKWSATSMSASGTTTGGGVGGVTYNGDTTKLFSLDKMPEEWGQQYVYFFFPSKNPADPCSPDIYKKWRCHINFDLCLTHWESTDYGMGRFGHRVEEFAIGRRKISHSYSSEYMAGSSERSNLVYFKKHGIECGIFQPVQTKDVKLEEREISIFPNPVQNELNISAPFEIADITITNTVGSIVHHSTHNGRDIQLQLADLPPSIYFLRLNGNLMYKISKQ